MALCAVALIGVGYAYTATVTTADNEFGSDYITIKSGTATEAIWSQNNTPKSTFFYDTETIDTTTMKYTSKNTAVVGGNIKVEKTENIAAANVSIKMSIDLTQKYNSSAVLSSDLQKLFYQAAVGESGSPKYASVSIIANETTYTTTASISADGKTVSWTTTGDGIPITSFSSGAKVSISPIEGVSITGTSAPSIDNLSIIFVAETVESS